MKRNIFNLMQAAVHRTAFCTLVLGLPMSAFAQTDDEEEAVETAIKQPDRSKLKLIVEVLLPLTALSTLTHRVILSPHQLSLR